MKDIEIEIRPIAYVEVEETLGRVMENTSKIVFLEDLEEALTGIEDFSHLYIIYWLHKIKPWSCPLKVHPRGNRILPLVGIFATRTPLRPNPLGLTIVKLVERNRNVLRVKGLDAHDGTPVIDVKPYAPSDIGEWSTPSWWMKLHRQRENNKF